MSPFRIISLFATASLLPAACLLAGVFLGGLWPLAALVSMTALVIVMDRFGPGFEAHASMAKRLPWAVGSAHFVILPTTVWALGGDVLDVGQKLSLGIAMGLYAGQVSNACAHELIHRSDRVSRWLGTAMYCSLLNGQHVSAHLLVHHVHAGTSKDPSSAPVGRGFYRFAVRAARAEFIDGWRSETLRQTRLRSRLHPYVVYLGGAALSLVLATILGGWTGCFAFMAIALHAQMQLLLSDYVQHYGLRRRIDADGKPEPMGPAHSWNAPQAYSAALMMNAPRHSDHHMRPARRFVDLKLEPADMPVLPRSMPVMAAVALIPPLWRHVMDPQVAAWARTMPHPEDAKKFTQPILSR